MFCAIGFGVLGALTLRNPGDISRTASEIRATFSAANPGSQSGQGKVLAFTTNAKDRFTISATVVPRGFDPLWAGDPVEALAMIRDHAGEIHLAIVDATLPGYSAISDALRGAVPKNHIVVLHASKGPEPVAPMILEVL